MILYSAQMRKGARLALLVAAIIVLLLSVALLAYTVAPRGAPVVERTGIAPVAPTAVP